MKRAVLLLWHHKNCGTTMMARSLGRRRSSCCGSWSGGGAAAAAHRRAGCWTAAAAAKRSLASCSSPPGGEDDPSSSSSNSNSNSTPPAPPPTGGDPRDEDDVSEHSDYFSSPLYRVEVSNADRRDATKLTVRGPDADGMIASMTLRLAQEGCSVVELHAQNATSSSWKEPDMLASRTVMDDYQIEDVFVVVDRATGRQFDDGRLRPLAEAVLGSLKFPMLNVVSGGDGVPTSAAALSEKLLRHQKMNKNPTTGATNETPQIHIIQSFEMPPGSSSQK